MDYFSRPSPAYSSRPAYMDQLFRTTARKSSQVARPNTPVELSVATSDGGFCTTPVSTRSSGSWKSTSSLDMASEPPSTPPQTPISEMDMPLTPGTDEVVSLRSLKMHLSPRFKKLGNMLKRRSHPEVQETTATDFSNWCAAAAEVASRRSQVLEAQRLQRASQVSSSSSQSDSPSSSVMSSVSSLDQPIQRASSLTTSSQTQRPTFVRCASACSTSPSAQAPRLDLPKLQTSFTPIMLPTTDSLEKVNIKVLHARRNSKFYAIRPLPALPPALPTVSVSSSPTTPTTCGTATPEPTSRKAKKPVKEVREAKELQCQPCYYFTDRNCNGYVLGGVHGDACESCANAGYFGSS